MHFSSAALPLGGLALSQSHAQATTVLFDEFDAGFLERSSQDRKSRFATLGASTLKLTNRHHSNVRRRQRVASYLQSLSKATSCGKERALTDALSSAARMRAS
jgi:hypothetical protein